MLADLVAGLPAAPAWVVLLLKVTALLVAAWWAHAGLAWCHPDYRRLTWRLAAVGLLALPLLAAWGPSVGLPLQPVVRPVAAAAPPAPAAGRALLPLAAEPAPAPRALPADTLPAADTGLPLPPWWLPLALLWAGGAALSLLRLAAGGARWRGVVRQAAAVPELAGLPGLRVAVSAAVAGPLLVGLRRPVLLLPPAALSPEHRADLPAVIAHEAAHLSSRDLWWNPLVHVAAAGWWHPLSWRVARAHTAACELACDRAAARSTGLDPYRRSLARVALRLHAAGAAGGIPMARTADVTRRLHALGQAGSLSRTGERAIIALVVLAVVTVVTLSGLKFYRRAPAGAYEKARGVGQAGFPAPDNLYQVASVTRWGRDGRPHTEDGWGRPVSMKVAPASPAAEWLDTVQIRLRSKEPFLLLRLRIFDHRTGKLLGMQGSGWDSVGWEGDRAAIRVRAAGRPLPPEVDVWMHVLAYPRGTPTWRLPAKPGATVRLPTGVVRVREIRDVAGGYSATQDPQTGLSDIHWKPYDPGLHGLSDTWVVLDCLGPGTAGARSGYLIIPVGARGRAISSMDYQFFNLPPRTTQVIRYRGRAAATAAFVISPVDREQPRFYFEGVRLPAVREEALPQPPVVEVPIHGRPGRYTSTALAPLTLRVQAERGETIEGSAGSEEGAYLMWGKPPTAENRATYTTVACELTGLYPSTMTLELLDAAGRKLTGTGSAASAGWRGGRLCDQSIRVPIERVDRVRVRIGDGGT